MKHTCYQMCRYLHLLKEKSTCDALKDLSNGHTMYTVVEAGLHLQESEGMYFPMTGSMRPSLLSHASLMHSRMCVHIH